MLEMRIHLVLASVPLVYTYKIYISRETIQIQQMFSFHCLLWFHAKSMLFIKKKTLTYAPKIHYKVLNFQTVH